MGNKKALVTGAGGFIGSHLVDSLVDEGFTVVAVDVKPLEEWDAINPDVKPHHNIDRCDLRERDNCDFVMTWGPYDEVYNLAADMGGMGFIETHKLDCMRNVFISMNMLESAKNTGVDRFFYASSACAYAEDKQTDPNVTALKESDAYPAMPEDGYGWEKLFSERAAFHYDEETDMTVRSARYHNVYGPRSTWRWGREKAPAALSRKVAEAALNEDYEIEIWGDGEQTRSFMFFEDCVEGTKKILRSEVSQPLNLGSSELVSINGLVDVLEGIAELPEKLQRSYDLDAPKGVRGRNSDNTLIKEKLGWEPLVSLESGMRETYDWVLSQVKNSR